MAALAKLMFTRPLTRLFGPALGPQPTASQAVQLAFKSLAAYNTDEEKRSLEKRSVRRTTSQNAQENAAACSFIPPLLQEGRKDEKELAGQLKLMTDKINQLPVVTADRSPFDQA